MSELLLLLILALIFIFTTDTYIGSKYRLSVYLICNNQYRYRPWKTHIGRPLVEMIKWLISLLQTCRFWLHMMLTEGLVDYCDVLMSCLDSHSDGTHSLQSIHWWASDAILDFSKSDEETNSSTSWTAWRRGHFQLFLYFWLNYSFKTDVIY